MKKTGFTITFEDGETHTRYLKAPYIEETSFDEEPRWGQLANLNELKSEVNKALKIFNENEFLKKIKNKVP